MRLRTPQFIDELLMEEAHRQGVTASYVATQRLAESFDIKPPVSHKCQGRKHASKK